MWNNFIRIILTSLLFIASAHAQDGNFTFIQEGERVPFTGTLFDPTATAKIIAEYEFLKEDFQLQLSYELALQKEHYDFEIKKRDITITLQREQHEASLALLDKEVEDLRKIIAKKPSKAATGLIIAGGFVAGVLTSVAIVYAVDGK